MASYHDDNFFFWASSLEATFSDGFAANGIHSNVTVHSGTPLGDEVWIVVDSENSPASDGGRGRMVRLIFIRPEHDWRRNQTYAWKLDSAWMSHGILSSDQDPSNNRSWLHWNVQSYVDSAIQVPAADGINSLFECDQLELHFRPILADPSRFPPTRNERLLLKDVQIGLQIPPNNHGSNNLFSPCPNHTIFCSIVDGVVQGNETSRDPGRGPTLPSAQSATSQLEVEAVFSVALAILLLCFCCWRRRQRSKLYQQLSPTSDEDLTLTVEDDTYQSGSEPRSSETGAINPTG